MVSKGYSEQSTVNPAIAPDCIKGTGKSAPATAWKHGSMDQLHRLCRTIRDLVQSEETSGSGSEADAIWDYSCRIRVAAQKRGGNFEPIDHLTTVIRNNMAGLTNTSLVCFPLGAEIFGQPAEELAVKLFGRSSHGQTP